MARARSYMRAPENKCARIYFLVRIYIWCALSNIWRAPDNIWRAPDHICAHQRIYMRTHIFSGARIYGARHLIYGTREIAYGARQIIYARTRKYMRTHIFSGARIYGARHLIYGARQIICRARSYMRAPQIGAHAYILWCAYICRAPSMTGARIYGLARAICYLARAIY